MRTRTLLSTALAASLTLLAPAVMSQGAYPNKPVRMIVPFPAGQATDMVARMLAEGLGRIWGQQVVVENRPGVPGMMAGKEALPDGYTITFGTSGTLAVNPAVYAARENPDDRRMRQDFRVLHDWAEWSGVALRFPSRWHPARSVLAMRMAAALEDDAIQFLREDGAAQAGYHFDPPNESKTFRRLKRRERTWQRAMAAASAAGSAAACTTARVPRRCSSTRPG